MTSKELVEFKTALENEQNELVRAALQRRQRIAIEQSAEAFEQISYATEREMALADLSRHSYLMRQIRAALGRIETGTYGVCQHCRKPIRRKRLIAVPWTPFCLECQETADGEDSVDQIRETAA